MKDFKQIKKHLHNTCLEFVSNRLKTVEAIMESNKNDLLSETKSSAGDKHETGRAMLQLEMEKASQQLAAINQMKVVLEKIQTEKSSKVICLGSLIITNNANYYLAISAGKILYNKTVYFAISTHSPIGQQLLGKKVGDNIAFNKTEIMEVF